MSSRTPPPLTRLWLALERLPGPAAVAAEWRHRLGPDYDLAAPLLQPDAALAMTFPRFDRPGESYAVVEHGPDDFVGVAEDGDGRVALTRSDLVVYRLSGHRLARALAGAFDLAPDDGPVDDHPGVFRVGLYRPLAGYEFPVYLTVQLEEPAYRAAVESLAARVGGPFLLLAPTNGHHRMASQLLLAGRNAAFLPLADAIALEDGRWRPSESARGWLAEFGSRVLPDRASGHRLFFPTPPGARWPDVQVRFVDGETITVKVRAVSRTLLYSDVGMSDGRSGRPTKQWELLREFARSRGTLTWASAGAGRKNQKRREVLAQDLRAFFRIDGDPFRLTPDGQGWQALFRIESD